MIKDFTKHYPDGSKSKYWCDDLLRYHRVGKPARIFYDKNGKIKSKSFYKHGVCHKENGAAYIEYNIEGKIVIREYRMDRKLFGSLKELKQYVKSLILI